MKASKIFFILLSSCLFAFSSDDKNKGGEKDLSEIQPTSQAIPDST